jgi:fructosamine-3-kinase
MPFDKTALSREQAEAVLARWLGHPEPCRAIERLHGGMVNSVLLLRFDCQPGQAVIKVSPRTGSGTFQGEAAALRYLKQTAGFPVPEVYLCESEGETVALSLLLLERLPGVNLGEAWLGGTARRQIDRQMADVLSDLHTCRRSTYGPAVRPDSEGTGSWTEWFAPKIRHNYQACATRIDPDAHRLAGQVLDRLETFLEPAGPPTLVHGDIWATNVIVDREDGGWRLVGFVDPGALYADVEYELAYLEVFSTVTPEFFEAYRHELRSGYELRRVIYWLNTMMLHVHYFGDQHYVDNTHRLVAALDRAGCCG